VNASLRPNLAHLRRILRQFIRWELARNLIAASTMTETPHHHVIAEVSQSARRAGLAVLLFLVWVGVTVVGAKVDPAGGYGWRLGLACLIGYSTLTVGALVALVEVARALARDGRLRSAVTAHLTPFWMLASVALVSGAFAVRYAADDLPTSLWLGLGTGLSILVGGLASARFLESRRLIAYRRQLEHIEAAPVTIF